MDNQSIPAYLPQRRPHVRRSAFYEAVVSCAELWNQHSFFLLPVHSNGGFAITTSTHDLYRSFLKHYYQLRISAWTQALAGNWARASANRQNGSWLERRWGQMESRGIKRNFFCILGYWVAEEQFLCPSFGIPEKMWSITAFQLLKTRSHWSENGRIMNK